MLSVKELKLNVQKLRIKIPSLQDGKHAILSLLGDTKGYKPKHSNRGAINSPVHIDSGGSHYTSFY